MHSRIDSNSMTTLTTDLSHFWSMKMYALRNCVRSRCTNLDISPADEFPDIKKTFKCFICKLKLSTKITLKKHILRKHFKLKPHTCKICDKKFVFEMDLIQHNAIHTDGAEKFKCNCGAMFKTYSSYIYHQKRFHSPSQPSKCTFCTKEFADKWQLKSHIQTTHLPKTIKCTFPSCIRVFATKALLHHHLRMHIRIRHECPICKKKFKLKKYMEKHKALHEGFRPFKCSDCEKNYISVSHVNEHWKRTHTSIRNFLCSICGKMFKSNYDVVAHENTHKEKVYYCDRCDFKGSSKHDLNSHMKSHPLPVIKLVADTTCEYSDENGHRRQKNAAHYINISSDSTPFKCVDCEKCFKTAVRVNEHWRRCHSSKITFKSSQTRDNKNDQANGSYNCDKCSFNTTVRIALLSHNKLHIKDELNREKELQSTEEDEKRRKVFKENPKNHRESNPSLQKLRRDKQSLEVPDEAESPSNQNLRIGIGKRQSKIKNKKARSVISDVLTSNFDNMNYYDDEGYSKYSEELLYEQPLLSYLNLSSTVNDNSLAWCSSDSNSKNNNNNNNNNENENEISCPMKSNTDNKIFACQWNGNIRNSRITLNCTAVNDSLEDSELLKLQNF